MFEFIISTNKYINGAWYGNCFATIQSINGDVFKYTSQRQYIELDGLLDAVKQIVEEVKRVGINIIDIQIKKHC